MRLQVLAVLSLVVVAACKSEDGPLVCADPATTLMFPTPAWMGGDTLTAPPGERGVEALRAIYPRWVDTVPLVNGLAQRPTFIIALDGEATSVDATLIALYSSLADGLPITRRQDVKFHAHLDARDHRTLIVEPINPLPVEFHEGVLAIDELAIAGAKPLPACAGGVPDPAYAAAMARLPEDVTAAFAMAFRTATDYTMLNDLFTHLMSEPALEVVSAESRALESFGDAAPATAVADVLLPNAASGVLRLPDYRADGVISREASGAPHAVGTTEPAFVAAFPATGSAPYPFVLYQHGGGQSPTDIFLVAQQLAAAGFAFFAIDLPEHGHRGPADGTANDLDYIHFEDLIATRSNFQQTVADHMAIMTGLDAVNAALEPITGAPVTLDPARGFYMGMSIGAISGSITFATTPNLRAGAVFVGAGGYPELVSTGLFSVLASRIVSRPEVEREVLLAIGETLLDAADPLAYAQRAEDRSVVPRDMIFFQAVGDPLIPLEASDQWSRAFGAEVALPRDHDVEAILDVELPTSNNFAWLPDWDHATRMQIQCPMNEVAPADRHSALVRQPYAQELVEHCFSGLLASDDPHCQIIDTGFSEH